jgi:hypothetical protein
MTETITREDIAEIYDQLATITKDFNMVAVYQSQAQGVRDTDALGLKMRHASEEIGLTKRIRLAGKQ